MVSDCLAHRREYDSPFALLQVDSALGKPVFVAASDGGDAGRHEPALELHAGEKDSLEAGAGADLRV
jgi:hypothetical protein